MYDRNLPASTTPTTGPDYMDDTRDEDAGLWLRSRDLLINASGVNTILANATVPITAYAEPLRFLLVPPSTNTGATKINIDGVGLVDLLDADGRVTVAGAVIGGRAYPIDYIGGAFRILTLVGSLVATSYAFIAALRQSNNVAAGQATGGAWTKYPLNTLVLNEIPSGASLASNQITLPAGTYSFQAAAPFFQTSRSKLRLQNITDGATLTGGAVQVDAATSDSSHVLARCSGRFTLLSSKVLELQYRVATTKATNGLGVAANFSETEEYGYIQITKVPT